MQPTPEAIIGLIAKESGLPPERLLPDATLASLGIESIDMVSVFFAIEDDFGIDISNEEGASAETLQDFIDIVMAKGAAVR